MGRQGIKSKNDKQHSLLKRMLMLSQAAQNETQKSFYFHQQLTVSTFHHLLQ
jgi:hypothetical protein